MARVQNKKLKVDAAAGVDQWHWYQRVADANISEWLAEIDAGKFDPFDVTDIPEARLPEIEGEFDFANVQVDDAGNFSDPATFPEWTAVSLDLSPPPAATGGTIEDVA